MFAARRFRSAKAVNTYFGHPHAHLGHHHLHDPRGDSRERERGRAHRHVRPAGCYRGLVLRVRANGRIADASVYRDVGYGVTSAVVPFADGLAVLVSPGTLYRTQIDGEREDVLFNPEAFGNARSLLGTDDGGFVAVLSRAGPDGNDLVKVDGLVADAPDRPAGELGAHGQALTLSDAATTSTGANSRTSSLPYMRVTGTTDAV